ncbi:NAD(P)H-hydrate dehydratase [Halopseudomonas salegens]|uniref:Bifunctional NAD(P)H-hydrate repair enzyme n=1 Tax=Halopseudomonas salegens TaxID=1434072 RepID=A0A1H2GJ27_9GAMM|nr:NAD(P)H-hydrate dehydratase [Halopseudomonas salegens]SDU19421.1 NAD(P)H-hydrate epimerase [Halopseudomonas salegens]
MANDFPAALYSAAATRELDAALIAGGISGLELMRRAADALWQALQARWPRAGVLTVFCGAGNNAGDGYLLAHQALAAGWEVSIYYLADPQRLQGDAATAWQRAAGAGIRIQAWAPGQPLEGVLVDALLGTGITGEVRANVAAAIAAINASNLPVVAVDLPSGLDADTGRIGGIAVKAQLTVTFIAAKLGLLTAQGPDHCGELVFAPLAELPIETPAALARILDLPALLAQRPPRARSAHKGQFGHLLLLGGDQGMGGAIMLAAETALRSGAGRVSVLTRAEHVPALLARCPEVMVKAVTEAHQASELLARANALVIGPGLGQSTWSHSLLEQALSAGLPQILDADALNLIAADPGLAVKLDSRTLMTPHPAEAARLLGCTTAEVQDDRPAAVHALAQQYSCQVVLKGVGSLTTGLPSAPGVLGLCRAGNPGMATAGMGDVLSGVCGALLAQGLPPATALQLAVLVHARAGDMAAEQGQWGLLASDLIMPVRRLLNGFSE